MQTPGLLRVWTWFETNKKQAGTGALTALVLGLIVWFVIWQRGEKEITAGEALSNASLAQIGGGRPESSDTFLALAGKYANSTAGNRAVLLAAATMFVEGKYPQAQAQFEKFAREHRDSPFMGQAMLGIAASLDAQGKTNDAVVAYKALIDHHRTENVAPQAMFALGRLYESQNKLDEARKEYEDAARADVNGSIGSEAGFRVEEMRLKYPNLFPVPVTPTNAVSVPSGTQ